MARFERAVDKTRPVLFYKEFICFLFISLFIDSAHTEKFLGVVSSDCLVK